MNSVKSSSNGSAIYEETLQLDKLGRIISRQEIVEGSTTTLFEYTYDLDGRLTGVNQSGQPVRTYQYDSQGNRLNDNAQYDSEDRLISTNLNQYTYNENGELLSKVNSQSGATTTYTYTAFGQLKRVSVAGKTIEYMIDGENHRVAKIVNGSIQKKYIYDQYGRLLSELNSADQTVSVFLYATQSHSPDVMLFNGKEYKLIKDQLGSVKFVVDASNGLMLQSIKYDEFGMVIADSNPGIQPFGFAGGIYDHETGLVRFGARDYDATVGRWTSKDPILFEGGDTNLYAYVNNDPINFIDPSGLLFGGIINAGERSATEAAGYWANEAINPNNSAAYRAVAVVGTGFAALWDCENSDATAGTLVSAYLVRVFGPFSAKGVPRSISKYRQYLRFDPPQHQKGWEFDGTIPKAIRNWFK